MSIRHLFSNRENDKTILVEGQTSFLDRLKNIGKEIFYFLTSGIFLKNFLGMLATIFFFLMLTFWWMKCYTKHGESLQVHDYVGMNIEDAIQKAEARSFNIVISDSVSRPDLRPGEIIDQNPTPLSRVKEDRTIYLQIAKTIPDSKRLPSLVGNYDFDAYSDKLAQRGLKGVIKKREFNSKYKTNTILYAFYKDKKITEEDINAGVEVPEGSTIEFVVTERGGTMVGSPDLVCMKYSEARFLLNNYNLSVGSIIKDATVRNQEEAFVWKQVPDYTPNQNVRIGGQYDIYLTQNRPDGCY